MALPVRSIGSQGLQASAQGLGCMGMAAFYGTPSTQEEVNAVVDRALELGVTLLDTSDMYGPFTNEKQVSEAIKGKRDKFVIATKCGIVARDGQLAADGSRKHVREACEASLQRLGIDCIDLYYLHRVDPATPVEETFAEFKLLQEEGKIKHVGISEAGPNEIRRAHAVTPISAVQLEWSLFTRDAEDALIPVCRELGIGIVAYSPLGRGFLTGAMAKPSELSPDDFRLTLPRMQGDAMERNMKLVEAVKQLAAAKGVTAGQLALAWVHAQGDDVFPIPGTRRVKYLEENAAAFAISQQLTEEDLKALADAVPKDGVVGDRYGEAMQKMTFHGESTRLQSK